eukprot:255717_1
MAPTRFNHLRTFHGLQFIPFNGYPVGSLVNISAQQRFIDNYITKPNDVYLISYPKAGQHLLKKICIEVIRHHDKERTHPLYATGDIGFDSVPLKEVFISQDNPESAVDQRSESLKDTFNLWWSHNPYSLFLANKDRLNPNTKYIVICRNPKDVLVSYWCFQNVLGAEWNGFDPKMSLNDFVMRFVSGLLYGGCYYQWMLGWFHAYNNQVFNRNGQMLWLYYEDFLNDPLNTISSVKDLLYPNDDIVSAQDMNRIVELTQFDTMKHDNMKNPQSFSSIGAETYFRQGNQGDWMKYLNQEQSDLLDEIMWIKWAHNGTAIKYYSDVMDKYASEYNYGYHVRKALKL